MSNTEIKKEVNYWRTPVSERKIKYSPTGEKIEDVWDLKLDSKGNEVFYISGKTNVYEKIQAHLEETKIENIIARCIETGDTTALEKAQGIYTDLSEFPTSYIEAHKKIKDAENTFNQLPLELRKKYDNNFNKYLADFGSEEWAKAMGLIKETSAETNNENNEKEKEEKEKNSDE